MPSAKIALISLLIIIALIIALYGQILIAQSSPVYPTGERFGYLLSGLQIQFRNATHTTSCTLGYFVKYQGRVALITAGHCFYTLQSAEQFVYQSTVYDDRVAEVVTGEWTGLTDYLISALLSNVSYATAVINITGPNTYNIIWFQDYATVADGYVGVGMRVCKTGIATGTTCGTVYRAYRNPYSGHYYIIHSRRW